MAADSPGAPESDGLPEGALAPGDVAPADATGEAEEVAFDGIGDAVDRGVEVGATVGFGVAEGGGVRAAPVTIRVVQWLFGAA